jgi:ABC-2 type transport system ATP-binding protein
MSKKTEGREMLEIKNLTKTYKGGKTAVANLSLTVRAGDIYGFIGHNGAGKTTTIKAVVGIHDFDQGEILVDGKDVRAQSMACKQVTAYIPDNPDIYEYLTGIQYLNFLADIYRVPAKAREERIRREAEDFGIYSVLGDLVSTYSHGMRQKLAIIGALLHEPKLLVLDEPFVGLDPEASLILKKKMHAFCEKGSAIFFSTHVLEVAEKLCNRIAVISGGKLVAEGDTKELTRDKSLEDVFMEVIGHDKAD